MKVSGLKDDMNGRGTFYVVRLKKTGNMLKRDIKYVTFIKKSIFLVSILFCGDRSLAFPLINGVCRELQSSEYKEKI